MAEGKRKVVVVKHKPKFNEQTMDYSSEIPIKEQSKFERVSDSKERQAELNKALQAVLSGQLPSDPDILKYLAEGELGDIMPIKVSVPGGITRGGMSPFAMPEARFNIEPMLDGNVEEAYSRKGLPYGKDFYDYVTNVLPQLAASRGKTPVFIGDVNAMKSDSLPYAINNLAGFDRAVATGSDTLNGKNNSRQYINVKTESPEHSDRLSNMLTAILNRSHDFTPLLAPKMEAVDKNNTGKSIPIKLRNRQTGEIEKRFIPVEPYYNSPLYNWNTDMWRNSPDLVEKLFSDPQYQNNWKAWGVADMQADDATGLPLVTETINQEGTAPVWDADWKGIHMPDKQDAALKVQNIQPFDYLAKYANLAAAGKYFPDIYEQYGGPQAYAEAMAKQGVPIRLTAGKSTIDKGAIRNARANYAIGEEADKAFAERSDTDRKSISDNNAEKFSNIADKTSSIGKNLIHTSGHKFNETPEFKTRASFNAETGRNEFTPETGTKRNKDRRMFVKNMFSSHERNAPQLQYLTNELHLDPSTDMVGLRDWTGPEGAGKQVWDDLSGQYHGAALAKSLAEAYADWKSNQPPAEGE